MKKNVVYLVMLVVFILAALIVPPVAAQDEIPGVPLDPGMGVLLGLAVTVSIGFVRLTIEFAARTKIKVPKWVMQLTVFIIGFIFTIYVFPVSLPAPPAADPVAYITYIGMVYQAIAPVVLTAFLVYDYLLDKVRDKLGAKLKISGFELG